jgi:hypothetical protein
MQTGENQPQDINCAVLELSLHASEFQDLGVRFYPGPSLDGVIGGRPLQGGGESFVEQRP